MNMLKGGDKNNVTAYEADEPARGRRRSQALESADDIYGKTASGKRTSLFDVAFAPVDRATLVPAGGATQKLARDVGVELFELKDMVEIFQKFDEDGHGSVDLVQFEAAVAAIFSLPPGSKVAVAPLDAAWKKAKAEGLEGFVGWFKLNQFSKIGDPTKESTVSVEGLADTYNVDRSQMMKVKKKFDEFDADGSGEIDHHEFKQMLAFFMRVKNIDDIPEQRVARFWAEIDVDQSGAVSFAEFVGWLAKTFPDYLSGGSGGRKTIAAKSLYRNQATQLASSVGTGNFHQKKKR
jgi:Ca2+-binding EF-hand superfamily protein